VFFAAKAVVDTPQACLVDLLPPTFAGVSSLTANADGSITSAWAAASDPSVPITYEVYILPGSVSAATLFAASPSDKTVGLSRRSYLDSNGDPLLKDQLYTFGVRCRDAVGNLNTNTATLSETAIGSVNLAQVYQDLQTNFATHLATLIAQNVVFTGNNVTMTSLLAQLQVAVDTINEVDFPQLSVALQNAINAIKLCMEPIIVQVQNQPEAVIASNNVEADIVEVVGLQC